MVNQNDSESVRQKALDDLHVLDTLEEQAYDDITRMAAYVCGTPIALISLSDHERQWFKSRVGLQVAQIPREHGFCDTACRVPHKVMIVEDTLKDERFATHPLVTHDPYFRFYAGAPLLTAGGHAIGTICVIDNEPRKLNSGQLDELQFLAQQVIVMLESRLGVVTVNQSEPRHR